MSGQLIPNGLILVLIAGAVASLTSLAIWYCQHRSLRAFIRHAPEAMCSIDRSKRIVLSNTSACQLLGYEAQELTGRYAPEIFPSVDWSAAWAHKTQPPDEQATFQEATCQRKDGSIIPIAIGTNRAPVTGKPVILVLRDMTEAQSLSEDLKRATGRLGLSLAANGSRVWEYDRHSQTVRFSRNDGCFDPEKLPFVDVSLHEAMSRVHPADRSKITNVLDANVPTSTPTSVEYRIYNRKQELRSISNHFQYNKPTRSARFEWLGISRDVTADTQRLNELDELRRELNHRNRVGAMAEMASGLAHEINQPLSAISTYAHASRRVLARDHTENGTPLRALSNIIEQCHRAATLIQDIRDLAHRQNPKRVHYCIQQLFQDLHPIVVLLADQADVEVNYRIDQDLPNVTMDPLQIQQVVLNLIQNGVEAASEASPRRSRLEITAKIPDHHYLKISVRDFGTGIDQQHIDRLFDPFFTTREIGVGMGLSLCKTIISAHGGKIGYQPVTGAGSEFWFTLPLHAQESPE